MKKARNLEAALELNRLQQKVHLLKGVLTPQAIIAVWLLLGDAMWETGTARLNVQNAAPRLSNRED